MGSSLSRPAAVPIKRGQILSLGSDGSFYPENGSTPLPDGLLHGPIAVALSSVVAGEFVAGDLLGGRRVMRALVAASEVPVVPGTALAVPADAAQLGQAGMLTPIGTGMASDAFAATVVALDPLPQGATKLIDVIG